MLIDQINLNQLRVFESVYRTKSMTQAARELHLTQSGVSQHIKALEDILGLKLFDRIKQKIVPTPIAKELYRSTAKSFEDIETALNRLKKTDKELAGVVSIGVPIQFGNNIIIPLLHEFQKKNPKVIFRIRQGFAHEMGTALLHGELDFAFVDSFGMDRGIKTEVVYDETLELCFSENLTKKPKITATLDDLKDAHYLDYQEEQSVLNLWFKHHFGTRAPDVDTKFYIMDAHAIAKMVLLGVGLGVVPGHLLSKMESDGAKFSIIKGSGKPLINQVSLAVLEDKTLTPAAKATFIFLKSKLAKS